MASIGGLTSSTSMSATSGLQGYGGLASGINRDEIIEQLTAGTQSKIDSKNQEKTKLEWIQDAIQNITGKMYNFSQKYMSYSSSSNLLGSTLFNRTDITASGTYKDYLTVSGSATTGNLPEILGVKQLAQTASAVSTGNVSKQQLTTGDLSGFFSENGAPINVVAGERIRVKIGDKSYTVTMPDVNDYEYKDNDSANIKGALQQALEDAGISTDQLEVKSTEGKLVIETKQGNTVTLEGDILKNLGFESNKIEVTQNQAASTENSHNIFESKTAKDVLAGQSISFVYNGEVKWIEMPDEKSFDEAIKGSGEGGKDGTLKTYLQQELDKAFGKGRIKVDGTDSLSFRTTQPNGQDDESSVLSISAATGDVLQMFGVQAGDSNRLNLDIKIKDLVDDWNLGEFVNYGVSINGKQLEDNEKVKDMTLREFMDKINNGDYGVHISYQENTDRFIATSTQAGAGGEVKLDGQLMKVLFGGDKNDGYGTVTQGQDAIFAVRYAGTNEVSEVYRGSNTLTIDGLSITAEKTFGYKEDGSKPTIGDDAVKFKAEIDTDKVTEVVKEMIDEYNEILKLVNDELKTKPNRDYAPLTSAQKAEMSEDEIKLWEEKAKEGLLFGDNDIRSLSNALRFVIPSSSMIDLQKIGISTSSEYSDNGKLVFDEEKFKAALEEDPENVRKLFSENLGTSETGAVTGGFMRNMDSIMDRFAAMTGSTKGILVERAGSEYSPLAALDNSILDQIEDIDDQIDRLLDRLTNEQDRYIKQFTQLETLVAQMNSQSGYLSSMFSSGY